MKQEFTALHDYFILILGALGGFLWYIGRLIFTNHKRIELLENENKHSDTLRTKQDELIKEIRDDQKKLITHVLKNKE